MRLLLVSDSHLAPEAAACNGNWQAARAFAGRADADLTVHLGDITLDGVSDRAQHAWALEACAGWPTPLRFLPGNHDIGDNPPAPGLAADERLDRDLLAQYRRQFGADYWSLPAGGWLLLALDAQLFGSGTAEEAAQWEWLEAQVAAAEGRKVALLVHKPLFFEDPAEATAPLIRYVPVAPRRRLLDLLARVELKLVLSGHTHQYLDRVVAGVRHIWLPSTAFILPDEKQARVGEKVVGVGLLDLAPDGARLDLVCPDGMARHDIVQLGLMG